MGPQIAKDKKHSGTKSEQEKFGGKSIYSTRSSPALFVCSYTPKIDLIQPQLILQDKHWAGFKGSTPTSSVPVPPCYIPAVITGQLGGELRPV